MVKIFDINKIWTYLAASIISFFEPIGVTILWMLIFVIADMATGIYAAYCNGEIITSHKMQRTVIKIIMYCGAIVLLEGLDVYLITFMELCLAQIGATLICGIELYSVFENCYKATGNPVFKALTQFTSKKIKQVTEIEVENDGTSMGTGKKDDAEN